jgi:15-cis-phytoene desaturase
VDAVEDFFRGADVPSVDLARFGAKMLDYLCTCDERRFATCEDISFWEYIDGDRFTPHFQRYLDSSRFMVAMDARRGSARTIAGKAIQMLLDFSRPDGQNDRVLDGPTTARWLDPWEAHLRRLGVIFHFGEPVLGLDLDAGGDRIRCAPTTTC